MKPCRFDYRAPDSLQEAVELLGEHGFDAKLLAGGQSLVPLLNMRLARPQLLVDLRRLGELEGIRPQEGALVIGAMTRQRELERSELVAERQPLLAAATGYIAHAQIRNRGTLGGSLAHADPAAVYPAVALALDAELVAVGPDGTRTIAAEDFFVSPLTTALAPAEILTEVRWPDPPARCGWAFREFSRRRGDFGLAGAAVVVSLEAGRLANARIAIFGAGPVPRRVRVAEECLNGASPEAAIFAEAARRASLSVEDPISDVHASAEYRLHLLRVMVRRALADAVARALGSA